MRMQWCEYSVHTARAASLGEDAPKEEPAKESGEEYLGLLHHREGAWGGRSVWLRGMRRTNSGVPHTRPAARLSGLATLAAETDQGSSLGATCAT